jgi:hypothetical protein
LDYGVYHCYCMLVQYCFVNEIRLKNSAEVKPKIGINKKPICQQQLHKMQGLVELPFRIEILFKLENIQSRTLAPRVAAKRCAQYFQNLWQI